MYIYIYGGVEVRWGRGGGEGGRRGDRGDRGRGVEGGEGTGPFGIKFSRLSIGSCNLGPPIATSIKLLHAPAATHGSARTAPPTHQLHDFGMQNAPTYNFAREHIEHHQHIKTFSIKKCNANCVV